MAQAAMELSLLGKTRKDKPWLNYLPRLIFVSDMADALSEEIDFDFLKAEIVDVVASNAGRRHIWLWLTKMPRRMAEFARWLKNEKGVGWPPNLVAMTTVTSKKTEIRAKQLLDVPAKIRGLSIEPLWEEVTIPVEGIDWCIVGGQSGPSSKPFDLAWVKSLERQCKASGTALFVKQLGAKPVRLSGKLKDKHGGDWNEWPREFRIREAPAGFRSLRLETDGGWLDVEA
jgi:protein gp37